jgi:hypothetical protein
LRFWWGPLRRLRRRRARRQNLAEPGISPDGREIAFASGGDIWTVPAGGGEARLLVSHPATESRPMYSPQGSALAFVSTRTGSGDIYVLHFETGALTRLTFDDGAEMLDGWSRDGQSIFFSSTTRDIAGMNDVQVVSVGGGTPPNFDMTLRGAGRAPSRSVLGQRSLERPTVLVTNQHSLSDAEDFTEGYRALGLGKVVGEPTAGWIIYTRNTRLVDGSTFRLPGMRITARDGSNMEMHPRPVDVAVTRPIGEALAGRDSQLEAAVKELIATLDRRSTQN